MKTITESVTKYQASDGTKFTGRWEAQQHEKGIPYSKYYSSLHQSNSFSVTEIHLKLIKKCQIEWCFFKDGYNSGHFYQDLVRPYGNSDWVQDIAEALGIKPDMFDGRDKADVWFSDELEYYLVCHHIDMFIVLQILCQNLSIKVGEYIKSIETNYDWVFNGKEKLNT